MIFAIVAIVLLLALAFCNGAAAKGGYDVGEDRVAFLLGVNAGTCIVIALAIGIGAFA